MVGSSRKYTPKQYIAWENADIDWCWTWEGVEAVRGLWNEGASILEISKEMHRPFIEVWFLIANLIWSNIIEPKSKVFCLPYRFRPKNKIKLKG